LHMALILMNRLSIILFIKFIVIILLLSFVNHIVIIHLGLIDLLMAFMLILIKNKSLMEILKTTLVLHTLSFIMLFLGELSIRILLVILLSSTMINIDLFSLLLSCFFQMSQETLILGLVRYECLFYIKLF